MQNTLRIALAVLLLSAAVLAAEEGRFFTYPTISGDKIAFTYESDLWVVRAKGGVAARPDDLPRHRERSPSSRPTASGSPSAADYDGRPAVYLMPAEGGAPTRLTYSPAAPRPSPGRPDGQRVVFRVRCSRTSSGRDPEALRRRVERRRARAPAARPRHPVQLLARRHASSLYNRRGNEEYYWKRYKGGQYTGHLALRLRRRRPTRRSPTTSARTPTRCGSATCCTSSPTAARAASPTSTPTTSATKQVAPGHDLRRTSTCMMPETDGRSIVFVQAGCLHVLDAADEPGRASVDVEMPSDRWALRGPDRSTRATTSTRWPSSNDGKTAVFEARGDVFLRPADDSRRRRAT
ncbi:MAG: hypothetical protein MZW92_10000 [Comamonadaceae bacterium]|nr:hypothetical protein [Comamonadaceae bacterium]